MTIAQSNRIASWQTEVLEHLARQPVCGYRSRSAPRIEPTAFTAMALLSYGRSCEHATAWLAKQQRAEGRVAVGTADDEPGWGTGLSMLAWTAENDRWRDQIDRGANYLLSVQGTTGNQTQKLVEHDTSILGWSWVQGTHSWVEPTAMSVLGLQATQYCNHARVLEGRRMLTDRLLPQGGCNYGNTFVLGQALRPHVQPTGLALMALVNARDTSGRIESSLDYLEKYLHGKISTASASYAILALAAHQRSTVESARIETVVRQTIHRHASPLQLALALLAVQGPESILVQLVRDSVA